MDLKTFEAVFADWTGVEFRIVSAFSIEDEKDALTVAADLALLEGRELIYCRRIQQGPN